MSIITSFTATATAILGQISIVVVDFPWALYHNVCPNTKDA